MNRIEPSEVSVIVIAKAPLPGRVKTRLIPELGPQGAAQVAAACLEDTLHAVAETPTRRRVLVLDGEPAGWLPDADFEVVPQREGGLAARLAGAFEDSGAAPAVLVGMDTPQITHGLLSAAIEALCAAGTGAVLGPASDGGYWLIGLRESDPRVFEGVPMSAGDTGDRQRARLAELDFAWTELEQLRDIDTIEDARAVAAVTPWTRFAAALIDAERETLAR